MIYIPSRVSIWCVSGVGVPLNLIRYTLSDNAQVHHTITSHGDSSGLLTKNCFFREDPEGARCLGKGNSVSRCVSVRELGVLVSVTG